MPEGNGFDTDVSNPDYTELIAVAHNETSTGVSLPLNTIYQLRQNNQKALIAVDAISSLPYSDFDCTQLGSVFFSLQKGFGLPDGLGEWIINDRCMTKVASLVSKGISVGSYHTIQSLHTNAVKNQTPETPNVLGIFLLNKVVQDFLSRGIDIIRKETEYKASILYQVLEQHKLLSSFVQDKNVRSKAAIVANCGVHTRASYAISY